jgi:hypothetical protein
LTARQATANSPSRPVQTRDVSFVLVVDLLAADTHRRADAEAALAQPPA